MYKLFINDRFMADVIGVSISNNTGTLTIDTVDFTIEDYNIQSIYLVGKDGRRKFTEYDKIIDISRTVTGYMPVITIRLSRYSVVI